jgi:hypothetical protein
MDDGGGDLRLFSDDGDTGGSLVVSYEPSERPRVSVTEYVFRVESGGAPVGPNAFSQEAILLPIGNNLWVDWGPGGDVRVALSQPGQVTQSLDADFAWQPDTDYHVVLLIDAESDEFDLTINGVELFQGTPQGGDFDELRTLAFVSNFSTLGNQVIDDITITALPEPSQMALAVAAIATVAGLARRRRKGAAGSIGSRR